LNDLFNKGLCAPYLFLKDELSFKNDVG